MSYAETIYQDIYGNGHGKETTITRFIHVLGMTRKNAEATFTEINNKTGEGAHARIAGLGYNTNPYDQEVEPEKYEEWLDSWGTK